jgi:isocitrate dehydrogenase
MILDDGTVLHEHKVEKGDIWRSASTRKAPIEDWVNLAIDRQKAEGCEAIFWLDETRAHDAELIKYVKPILEAKGVADKFKIMAPREATIAPRWRRSRRAKTPSRSPATCCATT